MKNTKQNAPPIHEFWINYLKTKHRFFFSFQGGKGNHVKALEVYCISTRGVYVTTLEVYTAKTLEVFCYQNVHWR